MRVIPQDVKELVFLVTEEVLRKENDVNMAEIIRTL